MTGGTFPVAGVVVVGGRVSTLSMVVPTASSGYETLPLGMLSGARASVTPSTLERPSASFGAWYVVAAAFAAVPAPSPAVPEPPSTVWGGMPMVGNDRNVGGCSCSTESCWLETA
ncbi:hypothetical protein ADK65_05450 [Streptomyces sp. NRRL B-1140]|nr:hypothetical protein ADK65_05450 [Streptomyces sp. NRRL B-1140]